MPRFIAPCAKCGRPFEFGVFGLLPSKPGLGNKRCQGCGHENALRIVVVVPPALAAFALVLGVDHALPPSWPDWLHGIVSAASGAATYLFGVAAVVRAFATQRTHD
jgi:hypothetical protein